MIKTVCERFLAKIEISETNFYKGTPCWEWIGSKNQDGYGQMSVKNKPVGAHRIGYELTKGMITKNLVIDHLCKHHSCVNPDHLEQVTMGENIRRGMSHNGNKTHCVHGHEFTPDNTYIPSDGYRRCRKCLVICEQNKKR